MRDLDALLDALDLIDEFTNRAINIVKNAPYHRYVGERNFAKLDILEDTDKAELALCEIDRSYDYDSATIERETVTFPALLLFMPEDEFAAWQKEQAALEKRVEEQRVAEQRAAREAAERATLAALKMKYER